VSAKGRKGKEVEENEFYPTERKAIFALLESDLLSLPGGIWIEPCAGTGRIVSTVNDFRNDVNWVMCELNENFDPYLRQLIRPGRDLIIPYGDFVHRDWPGCLRDDFVADVLIMNPPFSLTLQFVKAGLKRARHVVCLQRQGWFGTVDRAKWLEKHCPSSFQLPWRPSFRPDGKTDNCEYSWYHWPPGSLEGRREGRLAMLSEPAGGQQPLF
jgi:hypothetical protein